MLTLERRLLEVLSRHMSLIVARSTLRLSASRCHIDLANLKTVDKAPLATQILQASRFFLESHADRIALRAGVYAALDMADEDRTTRETTRVRVSEDADIVLARTTGRDFCAILGFSLALQNKVATAISELARNIVQYAGCGEITIRRLPSERTGVEIRATDRGPGIPHLQSVLDGTFHSKTGMGMGLRGAKRLMDEFAIEARPGMGTSVTLRKYA